MKIKIITFILTLSISCIIGQDLYRGAEVRTRADYLYGKFEVRYKPAQGDGLVSSFLPTIRTMAIHHGMKLISSSWGDMKKLLI